MPKLRSIVGFVVLASAGAVGIWWYATKTEKDRVIADQKRVITRLEQNLDTVWQKELVADVRVTRVGKDPESGAPEMDLTFVQYVPGTENSLFKRSMTLPGEEFYIDALVVRFERQFVEAGDGLRGKSMLIFRRAFGDRQKPVDGAPLFRSDSKLEIPELIQVDADPTQFEKDIWSRFWLLANDPKRAKAEGVDIAQGEAPHIKAQQGQVYQLTLRRAGGLEIRPRLPGAVMDEAPRGDRVRAN